MNTNTNKFAVQVSSPNVSEACQRIAFTFGYQWPVAPHQKVGHTNAKFLIFDPDSKVITWASYKSDVEPLVNQVVSTFDSLVGLFTNPPVRTMKIGNVDVFPDGRVCFAGMTMDGAAFDNLVKERNAFLGHKEVKRLPIVQFTYTSKSSGRKVRRVAVIETTAQGLAGLDLDDGNRFKRFLEENVSGGFTFAGFTQE